MKHTILILYILVSFYNTKAQHYTQNMPFDSTLNSGHYFVNGCTQTIQTKIELDPSLFTYVNGLEFMMIFDTVHSMGPSQVHSGDTLFLTPTNPIISFISGNGTNYWYRIKLVGTPTLAGQTYPCAIEFMQCTCFCFNATIKASITNTTTCTVDLFNSVIETENNHLLNIFPNPSNALVYIDTKDKTQEIHISVYDYTGKKIMQKNNVQEIDLSTQSSGIYFIDIEQGNKHWNKKIIKY